LHLSAQITLYLLSSLDDLSDLVDLLLSESISAYVKRDP
jgi:hypothetical protein